MKSRRDFLRSLPLLAAGFVLPLGSAKTRTSENNKKMNIGIQLWSLRELLGNDLEGTLHALSEMGFQGIEAYGFDGKFFGFEPKAFKKICKDLNLEIYSTHTGITAENAKSYAEKAAEAGLQYLVLPSMMGRPHSSIAEYQKVAEEMNAIGAICRQYGLNFAYHNHEFEFNKIDDKIPYDILLNETDPELVSFQLDVYWIVKAAYEPLQYFREHPGRFSTLHIKDLCSDGESCIIGNGIIDFVSMMKSAETASVQMLIYEQEHFSEGTPLHCAAQSLRYMKAHLTNIDF
jgi:sugar phosphate isomerase/epimerase